MTIDLCKKNRTTAEADFTPICTADTFQNLWRAAIAELKLPMLDCLPALSITIQYKAQFLAELDILRNWAKEQKHSQAIQNMLDRIDTIKSILEQTNLNEDDISFG